MNVVIMSIHIKNIIKDIGTNLIILLQLSFKNPTLPKAKYTISVTTISTCSR